MPAVKLLHQESGSNSKAEWIMGHSLQAISVLVQGPSGHVAAVPLVSRIHEGLLFTNRDHRTLLDKLVALLLHLAGICERRLLLVADAYYASQTVIAPLLKKGHHLVSRAKSNTVAYFPPVQPAVRKRGRPRIYGERAVLKEIARDDAGFVSAPSPVYGEADVMITYRCLDLLWHPVGHLVRFVIVRHPSRGTVFLLSTDLELEPVEIIRLYGYRFRIECGFRQAVHVVGTYAYHFWMKAMKPIRRGGGKQHLHRASDEYRAAVRRKMDAYHAHLQIGCIAQGLLLHLALNHTGQVWSGFRSWFRTMRPQLPPSELVVAHALRSGLPGFFASGGPGTEMRKILEVYAIPRTVSPPGESAA